MALIKLQGPKFSLKDGGSSNTYIIGSGDETSASWITLDIRSVSATGNITVVGRSAAKYADDDALAFLPIMYKPANINGVAAAGSPVATAITTDSIIVVPASGQTIALLAGGVTTGSWTIYVTPTAGQGY